MWVNVWWRRRRSFCLGQNSVVFELGHIRTGDLITRAKPSCFCYYHSVSRLCVSFPSFPALSCAHLTLPPASSCSPLLSSSGPDNVLQEALAALNEFICYAWRTLNWRPHTDTHTSTHTQAHTQRAASLSCMALMKSIITQAIPIPFTHSRTK